MAIKGIQMYFVVVAIVVGVLGQGAMAQSGCTSAIMTLAPCLGYIQGSSSNPSSSCCSQLASVVQSQPRCLCSLLNGGTSQIGITINQTLALALPAACNVKTPPISQCNNNGSNQPSGPTASPVDSPVGSPDSFPGASPVGSPVGSPDSSPGDSLSPDGSLQPTISGSSSSKTVPLTNGSTSDGNMIAGLPLRFTIFLLFITSIAATTIKI